LVVLLLPWLCSPSLSTKDGIEEGASGHQITSASSASHDANLAFKDITSPQAMIGIASIFWAPA